MIPIKPWMKQLPPDAQKLLSEHFWDLANNEPIEPKIWLSLDEAKFLKQRVLKATNFRGSLNLTEEEIDMFDAIEKRIEKLEKP